MHLARYNDHFIQPHHAKELHAAYAGDKALSTAEAQNVQEVVHVSCLPSRFAELHHG